MILMIDDVVALCCYGLKKEKNLPLVPVSDAYANCVWLSHCSALESKKKNLAVGSCFGCLSVELSIELTCYGTYLLLALWWPC
jgi:hypothetical protein